MCAPSIGHIFGASDFSSGMPAWMPGTLPGHDGMGGRDLAIYPRVKPQAPTALGSRQARSKGRRQAWGAMSWWIDCGPQEPGA